ncbi:hypothetical protein OTU49_015229, partial [Cherax quadricarinatus]
RKNSQAMTDSLPDRHLKYIDNPKPGRQVFRAEEGSRVMQHPDSMIIHQPNITASSMPTSFPLNSSGRSQSKSSGKKFLNSAQSSANVKVISKTVLKVFSDEDEEKEACEYWCLSDAGVFYCCDHTR